RSPPSVTPASVRPPLDGTPRLVPGSQRGSRPPAASWAERYSYPTRQVGGPVRESLDPRAAAPRRPRPAGHGRGRLLRAAGRPRLGAPLQERHHPRLGEAVHLEHAVVHLAEL